MKEAMHYFLRRFYPAGLVKRWDDLADSPTMWLGLYFVFNLSLTLYNKSVLMKFPFPYVLTAVHAFCGAIGTFVWLRRSSSASAMISDRSPLTKYSHQEVDWLGLPSLSGGQIVVLLLFSFLYTINIVVSNGSLKLVTVPFHQVVRASTPFFTVIFSAVLLSKRCGRQKVLSLVPVVAGVGFATYGDYSFTAMGFMLTLFGTVLAAMKTVITNVILIKPQNLSLPTLKEPPMYSMQELAMLPMTDTKERIFSDPRYGHATHIPVESAPPTTSRLIEFFSYLPTFCNTLLTYSSNPSSPVTSSKELRLTIPSDGTSARPRSFTLPKLTLSPLHLLLLLSPLAFIETMLLAHLTGELDRVFWFLLESSRTGLLNGQMTWLLMNGILAFFLNVVSFNTNRRLGPLAMTVAANVKQVLTILCAIVIFDVTITLTNGVGIALTLVGGVLYAVVELKEKDLIRRRRIV